MSDVVDWLERLGQDARLKDSARTEVDQILQNLGVSAEMRAALAAGDPRQIESLLGVDREVCCLIYIPREQPDEQAEPHPGRPAPDEEELTPIFT